MLEVPVAAFNETTGWTGRRISFVDGRFILEGHGPILATDVMACDRRGQLSWARRRPARVGDAVRRRPSAPAASPPLARPDRQKPKGRSMAAWKIALIAGAALLVYGAVQSAAVLRIVHQLGPPQGNAQGHWKTYTNTAGGYRISYPAAFHESSYDSGIGDPGLCARFVDPQGGLYVMGKGRAADHLHRDREEDAGAPTNAEAASDLRYHAQPDEGGAGAGKFLPSLTGRSCRSGTPPRASLSRLSVRHRENRRDP